MSDIKKFLSIFSESTTAGSVASVSGAVGNSPLKRPKDTIFAAEDTDQPEIPSTPTVDSPANFDLWRNSKLLGKEQNGKHGRKKMTINKTEMYPQLAEAVEPEQEVIDATRRSRMSREQEPAGSDKIDAKLAANNDYIMNEMPYWIKIKSTQEYVGGPFKGKKEASLEARKYSSENPEAGEIVLNRDAPQQSKGLSETYEEPKDMADWTDEDWEEWDRQVKSVGQKAKKQDSEEKVNESKMSEVDQIIRDLVHGDLDAYNLMNHPKDDTEKYVARELHSRYVEVANDHGLHPDDDFEKILDIVVDNMADDYGIDGEEGVAEGLSESLVSKIEELGMIGRVEYMGPNHKMPYRATLQDKSTGKVWYQDFNGGKEAEDWLANNLADYEQWKKKQQGVAEGFEFEDAYGQGYSDGYDGKGYNSPFEIGSNEDDEYEDGYSSGRLDYNKMNRDLDDQGVAEGMFDSIKKGAKKAWGYATEPSAGPHQLIVKDRAKNIAKIRKQEAKKSVFEKDPEAEREFERSGGYEAGLDVMGWQVGWAAAKHARGDTMTQAFDKLYYGGGSPFPFSQRSFKLAWVAYNKHHGPQVAMEQGIEEDDAGDIEQRMIAKIAKYKEHLAHLKKTDPEAYKREMAKRESERSRMPAVSTFEGQELSEEMIADRLKNELDLFKKGSKAKDNDLGSKPKDREVQSKKSSKKGDE